MMTPGYKSLVECRNKLTVVLCVFVPAVLLFSLCLTVVDYFPPSTNNTPGIKLGQGNHPAKGFIHGGVYEPLQTNSTKRAAIILLLNEELIVPFTPVVKHLHRVLVEQGLPYGLFTVKEFKLPREKYSDEFFQNWGALFNAAVLEIVKYNKFDCFFFHDFSILPIVFNSTSYQCPEDGVVIQSAPNTKTITYEDGYLALTKDDFMRMNGFSNCYPYDDDTVDELALRLNDFNLTLKPPAPASNPSQKATFNATRLARDGLSSVEYVLQAVDVSKLHTNYQFSLKETRYIKQLCKF